MLKIKEDIYWVGIKDSELRRFHGHELSTHRGSTYNSYIIKDKKTVLVDTVWSPYKEEFVQNLEKEIGLDKIDAIVINHIEPDHGGSLGLLMDNIPDVPIYCTKNGADIIKRHFHKDWNFNIVKTGDTLDTGEYELVFIEMQMLHWPDSMATYVKRANVLLSSDAFGQHYSTASLFNDEVDSRELYEEALKYYANILTPFSALAKKKIEQIKELGLPIEIIAPSHGVIWRENPMQIIEKYYEWSKNYDEGTAVIVYDTMYEATKTMAEAVGEGLAEGGIKFSIHHAAITDRSDLLTEIFKAKAVIIGSCTVNNIVMRAISSLLDDIKGIKFKGKLGASFGSYGWSGEAPKIINKRLDEASVKMVYDPVSVRYRPTPEELKQCVELGKQVATSIKQNLNKV